MAALLLVALWDDACTFNKSLMGRALPAGKFLGDKSLFGGIENQEYFHDTSHVSEIWEMDFEYPRIS